MKTKIILLFLPFLLVFLSGSYLEQEKLIEEQLNIAKESNFENHIPDETKNILNDISLDEINASEILSLSFSDIVITIFESFSKQMKEPFFAAASVLAAILICSFAKCFTGELGQSKTVINTVAALSSASCILIPIKESISSAVRVIEECSGFMISFIPVYSSAAIASGSISSAAGFRTLMLGVCTIMSSLANKIAVPLICIYFALCIAGSISEVDISGISKSVKNFAIWIITLSASVFSGIMGLGTLVSSSVDNSFSKTTKFLIGSTIPVVGGMVSDAFSAVAGCLGVTKNILGIYSIIVIAVIFIPPLTSLILWRICLFALSLISSVLENKNLSGLMESASCVIGIMLALVAVTAVMFIFSITIMLMTGGGN